MENEQIHFRGLQKRLWAVLVTLVLLAFANWLLLDQVTDANENSEALVNLSGKQRMLSQRVVMLAQQLVHGDIAERSTVRQSLEDSLRQMEKNHLALSRGDAALGIHSHPPAKALTLLFGPDGDLDRQVRSFLVEGYALLRQEEGQEDLTDKRLNFLYDSASQILLKNLDRMVVIYQQEGEGRTHLLENIFFSSTLLTLLTLAVSWWVVLAPVFKRLTNSMEEQVRQQAEIRKLSMATDLSPAGVIISNGQGVIEYVNPRLCEMTGYSAEELIGHHPRLLKSTETPQRVFDDLWQTILAGRTWHGVFINKKKSGQLYHDSTTIRPILDQEGKTVHYLATKQDISEQLALEQALREAKEQAETANRAKSDFLASMSHELRTPMNAILGFAQLLEEEMDPAVNPEQVESVQHIYKAGQHLLGLINEILDLSRIEAGKMTVSLENVKLQEVITQCLPICQAQADRLGISVIDHIKGGKDIHLLVDFVRLKQVLLNLISNAIKYNRDDGSVELLVEEEGGQVRILVKDTGPGIPRNQQDQLFVPFQRLGRELSHVEGTGIGLTITKRWVELMGGRIGFTSEEGKGSTFWVAFAAAPTPEVQEVLEESTVVCHPWDKLLTLEGGVLLYVEDNPANLRLLEKAVARIKHFTFQSTHNGDLGWEMAKNLRPRIIVLDLNLPGKNGFQILQQLRNDPDTVRIPVIALTSHARQEDIDTGLAAGFNAYLTKPMNLELFYNTLYQLLNTTEDQSS
ncbi:MAG: response regulator [Magnetococcales bacterium]|nr:response regulator [Magnetococcales bacterium]